MHALSQLAKVKIAQGEYAAAWDARNAATQLREAERAEAESAVTADPSCAMDVASLLETHARELRDLRVTQRARHARLDRELADALQRRGLPVDATAEAGVEAEWRRLRRGLPASVDAGARLDAGRPNLLEGPPESGARFASPASAAASFVSASPRPIALDGTPRSGSRDARAAPPPPTPSWGAFRTPERHARAHLRDAAPRAMPQPQMLGAAASFLAASGGPSPGGGGEGGGGGGGGGGGENVWDDVWGVADANTVGERSTRRPVPATVALARALFDDAPGAAEPSPRETAPPARHRSPLPGSPLADANGREADPERSRRPSPKAFHVAFPRRASWMRSPTPPDAHARPPASWAPLAVPDAGVTASSADSAPPPRVPPLASLPAAGGGRHRAVEDWRATLPLPVASLADQWSDEEMRRRSALRARDPETRAAAARAHGEYRDPRGAASDAFGAKRTTGARARGFEPTPWGSGPAATDAGRVLRLGENARGDASGEGEANDDSRGVSSGGATNRSSDDDLGDVWARHADEFRAAADEFRPGAVGGVVRRGAGATDEVVTRTFAGEAAVEAAALARDADEDPDAAVAAAVDAKRSAANAVGRRPAGEFRDERRGNQRPGKGLPSAREDHTRVSVRT